MSKQNITYRFSADNFELTDNNLATFDIVASKANTMTTHSISFQPGAFKKAIVSLRDRRKMLPMFFNHNPDEILGGFPVNDISERAGNLKMKAQLNLDIAKAKEVYSLIKQNVLTDVSVGVSIDPSKMKYDEQTDSMQVKEVSELFETSVVWSGANPEAVITSFSATAYGDLPVADEGYPWDSDKAIGRIKKLTKSSDTPNTTYKEAFMWFDADNIDNFTAYKLPFADVIDGKLKAVPKALSAVVGAINGSRGGVKIPKNDESKIKRNINKYYAKMGQDKVFAIKYIDEYNIVDCEKLLINSKLSKSEAKTVISLIKKDGKGDVAVSNGSLSGEEINQLLDLLNQQELEIKLCHLKQALQI